MYSRYLLHKPHVFTILILNHGNDDSKLFSTPLSPYLKPSSDTKYPYLPLRDACESTEVAQKVGPSGAAREVQTNWVAGVLRLIDIHDRGLAVGGRTCVHTEKIGVEVRDKY